MKYFLACEHCAHNNEVTSEYLTFCESCNKKLSLNFRDWQKKHRDANLTDYMEKVCVSEGAIEREVEAIESSKKDAWSHWIGISKTLAVIIGVGFFVLPIYLNIRGLNYTLEASTYATHTFNFSWEEKTYGSFGLSIDSPIEITKWELPLPDQVKSVIEAKQSFRGGSEEDLIMIMLNNIQYLPEIGGLNLEGAAAGSVNSMKATSGVSNFNFNETYTSISGMEGFRQDGSYIQGGEEISFVNVGLGQGLVYWQILIVYQANIPELQEVVDRVINSIDIQYNSSI